MGTLQWSHPMQAIATYGSDDEEVVVGPLILAPQPDSASATGVDAKAQDAATRDPATGRKVSALKLRTLLHEVQAAKSATAVVLIVRRYMEDFWDTRWGSEALFQIARRSTARTRREWANDGAVLKLAAKLKAEAQACVTLATRTEDDVNALLIALVALRRMNMQDADSQKDALERAIIWLVADNWRCPVKSLARLYWLSAPLKLKGRPADFSSLLPAVLKSRTQELDGPDVALLLAAFRHSAARDAGLLEKVVARLKTEGIHGGVSGTDLVEMAESLRQFGVDDEGALRPLGQEILRRRGELSPDESHRAHTAFQALKLPLPQVWMQPGASVKRDGSHIVTVQAFAPQEGHEKKRRGNHDIERTSPPRVVRDYKMMSY